MKKIIVIFLCACSLGVQAQFFIYKGDQAAKVFSAAIEVKLEQSNEFPSYIELKPQLNLSEELFFNLIRTEFELSTSWSFKLLNTSSDKLGFIHNRYRLSYSGIEVAYSSLSIHSKNGSVVSASGNLKIKEPKMTSVSLDENIAQLKAINFVGAQEYMWDIDKPLHPSKSEYYPSPKLAYLPNYFEGSDQLSLAYVFNIYATKPLIRELIFIDAKDGNVVFHENLIHSGGDSKGTAITAYSDTQKIITDSLPSVFRLRDSVRGNGITTLNSQGLRNYTGAVDFLDSNNFWNNFNASVDEYAGDTHWGTEATYDYLLNVHSRNSIDDSGFALTSFIHYDQNYVNAFWNGSVMTYGDGNNINGPLTTLDIVGHEITHGLTDFTSDLIYANESGALNESFSDIFGTALEFYARPSRANWTVGEDIGGAFRSMSSPKNNGDPDTYDGLNWIDQNCAPTAGNDRCGVHTNSGVQNHWFYLLVTGAIGVNDVADSFTVVGLGMNKAERIAFRNLTVYLNASSNHDEARFYAIKSAIDLYGACSLEVEATTNAWYAVGVGDEYQNVVSASFSAVQDTAFCYFPVTLDFSSVGSNVQNFNWDFGNGTTSSLRAPAAFYGTAGTYSVELIADGGTCGADTVLKTNYIILDTSNVPCSFALDNSINILLTDCNGRLFDSGGFGNDYGTNENGTATIIVGSSDYIELDFISLAVEAGDGFNCNKDFVEVYDGPDVNSPLIGRFCTNFPPLNNKVTSRSNSVTVRMISDAAANDAGFLINWECKTAVAAPIADLIPNADTTCSGEISFVNATTGGYSAASWDFGDGTSSSDFNPVHSYYLDGSYDVSLTVTNSSGSNTVTKSNAVTVAKLATPTFVNDTVCIGEQAGLKLNVATNARWYRDSTVSSVFSGDSLSLLNMRRDTTLFVKKVSTPQTFSGGPLNNIGAGGYSTSNDYITFDVHKPILLKTMILFSNKAATRRMDIWNRQGVLVASRDVYVPSSALRVNLNIELQPDSNYRVSFSDRDISMFKNSVGAIFPYTISNLVTLKGSNANGEYPYFYRWGVSELPCESNFATIKAVVDSSCTLVGISDVNSTSSKMKISPNPFSNQVTVIVDLAIEKQYELVVRSVNGQEVYRRNIDSNNSSGHVIELGFLSKGVYILNLIGENEVHTKKVIKFN